ncbi:MAG: hypothetical protein AAGG07_02295 [Planctomycetota bacterium]
MDKSESTGVKKDPEESASLRLRVREGYLTARNLYQRLEEEHEKSLTHWLLTLSGGGLGLSLTFAKDTLGEGTPVPLSLKLAWGGFAACILLTLIAIKLSARAAHEYYTDLDEEARKLQDEPDEAYAKFFVCVNQRHARRRTSHWITRLDFAAVAFFLFATSSWGFTAATELKMSNKRGQTNKADHTRPSPPRLDPPRETTPPIRESSPPPGAGGGGDKGYRPPSMPVDIDTRPDPSKDGNGKSK